MSAKQLELHITLQWSSHPLLVQYASHDVQGSLGIGSGEPRARDIHGSKFSKRSVSITVFARNLDQKQRKQSNHKSASETLSLPDLRPHSNPL
jgi:hypothetical protein